MAGTTGRKAVVKPAAVRVGDLIIWCSTRPNAAILEQTINSVYQGEPAELDLHPDVLVNPSHGKVFEALDKLGLTRIPGDGEDAAGQPDAADDDTPAPAPGSEPVAAPAKRAATGSKTGPKTGPGRSKAATG